MAYGKVIFSAKLWDNMKPEQLCVVTHFLEKAKWWKKCSNIHGEVVLVMDHPDFKELPDDQRKYEEYMLVVKDDFDGWNHTPQLRELQRFNGEGFEVVKRYRHG